MLFSASFGYNFASFLTFLPEKEYICNTQNIIFINSEPYDTSTTCPFV